MNICLKSIIFLILSTSTLLLGAHQVHSSNSGNQTNSICPVCNRPRAGASRSLSYSNAKNIMQKLRLELAADYGYDDRHHITLKLVDKKTMTQTSGSKTAVGYTRYKTRYKLHKHKNGDTHATDIRHECTIFLLKTLSEDRAHQVLVHELTHDYLFHNLGKPQDSKINEGICEAMAGAWLEKHGKTAQLERMKKNPNPIYGEGFREMYPQLKRYGFKELLERSRSAFKPFIQQVR